MKKIVLHSKGDLNEANGDDSATFRSQNKTEIIGESILNMYGGLIEMFDGAIHDLKGSRSIIPFLTRNSKGVDSSNNQEIRVVMAKAGDFYVRKSIILWCC